MFEMVFQYDLCGTAERGADSGKLNQDLGTVTPILDHALHALKMTDCAGKSVDYCLGLSMCMSVSVEMTEENSRVPTSDIRECH